MRGWVVFNSKEESLGSPSRAQVKKDKSLSATFTRWQIPSFHSMHHTSGVPTIFGGSGSQFQLPTSTCPRLYVSFLGRNLNLSFLGYKDQKMPPVMLSPCVFCVKHWASPFGGSLYTMTRSLPGGGGRRWAPPAQQNRLFFFFSI